MKYRREIDGLRALAVLPVILFHAGFEMFGGGFVGVDVFFVISGYLITTVILAELEQDNFSIIKFYEHRARRILPALFLVTFVCIPFAQFWLSPSDMKDFSKSLVAVFVFASNILFWRESGYFDTAAEFKPLLHTWSLAVEEQFYVLLPLLFMIMWKLGKRYILITLGFVFVFSIGLAQWAAYAKPSAAFFLLPTRGWELMIGSFAAFYLAQNNSKEFGKVFSEIGALLGLGLISYSVFAFSKATPFPGFYALIPTLGTLLIILLATQQTTVGKFIGNKVFVGIGLISYSAYLWHQPLFAFARHYSLNRPSHFIFIALSILSLVLAFFSWKYIEIHFRNKELFSRKQVFIFSLVGSLFFIGLGFQLENVSNEKINSRVGLRVLEQDWRSCLNSGGDPRDNFIDKPCVYSNTDSSNSRKILLIGDSHAQVLHYDISRNLKNGADLVLYAGGSCPPFFKQLSTKCAEFHKESAAYVHGRLNVSAVVLAARWSFYLRNKDFSVGSELKISSRNPFGTKDDSVSKAQSELRFAIDYWLSKKVPVIFVTDYPTNGSDIGRLVAKYKRLNIPLFGELTQLNATDYYKWTSPLYEVLKSFEKNSNFYVVDSYESVCFGAKVCSLASPAGILLGDDNHASRLGTERLSMPIAELVDKL
jgi:peptidoglycan/LPS O-acetylase OafA/YrhL